MFKRILLLVTLFTMFTPCAWSQAVGTINTVAGGVPNNVPALQVSLGFPTVLARDASSNLYVAVEGATNSGGAVYKIDSTGNLTTFAGNGGYGFYLGLATNNNGDGGPATNAQLGFVDGLAFDPSGNLFIADSTNNVIREVNGTTGIITTYVGGGTTCALSTSACAATSVALSTPGGLATDSAGNLYIAATGNNSIAKVTASTGMIQIIAGGGAGCTGQLDSAGDNCAPTSAILSSPHGVFVDASNNIYITDPGNARVREVFAATGLIQTIAGTGTAGYNGDNALATSLEVNSPYAIQVDASGNVFFADQGVGRVREVLASNQNMVTVAGGGAGCTGQTDIWGDGCAATTAQIGSIYGLNLDPSGTIFVVDLVTYSVREVPVATGIINIYAGNGTFALSGDGGLATNAQFYFPYGVAGDTGGNFYIADSGNSRIRKVLKSTGVIQTVAGGGTGCAQQTDTLGDGCPATQAILEFVTSVFVDSYGNIFISDFGNSRVREVVASTGLMQTVAGGGTGCAGQLNAAGDNCLATQAVLSSIWGVYVDSAKNVFICDYGDYRIREVAAATGIIETIAGTGTTGYNGDNIPAITAEIGLPTGISGDANGNIYFSDSGNFRVREIIATTGQIVTIAGTGVPGYNGDHIAANTAEIGVPYGLFVDSTNNVFITDTSNSRIREVVASTGSIQTVAGTGGFGFNGDGGPATSAQLGFPIGLGGDPFGNLYISDEYNDRIREVFGTIPVTYLTITAQSPPPGTVGVPYSYQFMSTGGTSPVTGSIISGSLPPGLTLGGPTNGLLSGTPTAAGTFTFVGQATDSSVPPEIVQTATITITIAPAAATLMTITVIPSTPTLSANSIQQFIAIGNYSDGTTQNLSSTAVWGSSLGTVATVTSLGLATGVGPGTSTITATVGNVSGSTVLTVTATVPTLYVGSVQNSTCCLDAINTSTNTIVATIPVTAQDAPFGLSPDQKFLFIPDNVNNLVDGIDPTTNTLVNTIPVGVGTTAVAMTPNGQFGYVADLGDANIDVFNVSTGAVTATIPIGFSTGIVAITPDGSLVYATSVSDGRIAVINTATNTLASTITLAPLSTQSATGCVGGANFNPTGTLGYFSQSCQATGAGSITVLSIPSNTPVATVAVGTNPFLSVITPDGAKLYVPNALDNTVSVLSTATNTVTSTITVGTAPQSLAVSPDGSTVYVANTKSSTISVISTATDTVTSTISVTTPFGMVIASPPPHSTGTVLTLTPPNLNFGSVVSNTTGTPSQSITVTNPGTTAVTLTSVALTGPATAQYALVNNCPASPTTLGAGSSCTLTSTFLPTTTGPLDALITITNSNGTASYTQSAPMSGMGTGSTVASFSGLTASQTITAGAASISLSGVIGTGSTFPAAGEVVLVVIDGITHGAAIGTNGAFTLTFATNTIPGSTTPYPISYFFAGDATFTKASDSTTTLTVNAVVPTFVLTVTDIGTGNGTVTDNLSLINCVTSAGVQSGTCAASYAAGTNVTLTATPSSPTTFAAWGGACSGTGPCVVTMTAAESVSASFTPPPQQISLNFTPGTNASGMATYDCPSNPSPSPANPCLDANAHALALAIPQVLQPFTITVQASELPPAIANGICPNGATPSTDFDCRFTSFFTYQTLTNGDKVVPLCYPYANGNCVHYQVFSGTPGTEPDPTFYVGPIDWNITWNNDTFTPPAPYTGSTPRLFDDPDYAVSTTSPYGTDCTTPMLVGNPPVATNPAIYCQFEFDITTSFNATKKVDAAVTGRTRQFNDVVVAFAPTNVGILTITEAPLATPVTAGSPIGYTITVADSAGGAVTGATLTDVLPAGTNVNWTISPAYAGSGTCAITGAVGSQVLSCAFGTISASQTFTIGLLSSSSTIGSFTDTTTLLNGTQQSLAFGAVTVQGLTSAFTGLTPSQTITAGTASISLAGTIASGVNLVPAGEAVTVTINGAAVATKTGSGGAFVATFSTANIPASTTPYVITYSYAGDGVFTAATDTSTTLTVNAVIVPAVLIVTDIGTGNGAVTDNFGLINCVTTVGVQSGTCSASYTAGTQVSLTATPSSPSTFAAWGGACTGTSSCVVKLTASAAVSASFTPPPQQIALTLNPGTASTAMATYNCPGNPSPSPSNPCTAPNAHAVAFNIGQVLQPFTLTVQASEVPPSVADGLCPNGLGPLQDFDCRFVTFFTYQTLANGDRIVPLCYPYANGNCVHYQVFSGTPGTEPDPSFYVGPVDWSVTWNNDTFTPPAPYTGSTPRLYDDPDYAVSATSPYGTDCTTPMLVGNPPVATNPAIYCQFEFDITTSFNPTKKVDAAVTGRTRQFNDVVVAFPPTNVGNLTVSEVPLATSVAPGNPIGFTITITNSAGGPVVGATLTDTLPAGTNVNWTITPAYSGPGSCSITGTVGSQVLSCAFGTISASETFTIGLQSANSSIGTYTDTATIVVGTQQILSIGSLAVQGTSAFTALMPSQTITAGTASINLSGAVGSGTNYPPAGETVSVTINGLAQTVTIGSSGAFNSTFATASIPASSTPYVITYSYAGDLNFTSATDISTTLTVSPNVTPSLQISPTSIDFGQVPIGDEVVQSITLTNTGTSSIGISSVARSHTGTGNYRDYYVINRCPKSLAAGKKCTIAVSYAPEYETAFPASSSTTVLITDTTAGSPQSVSVKAQNINPRPKLSPTLLEFGDQKVGTTSTPETVSLTNVGTTPLNLKAIAIHGDFSVTPSGTCSVGTSLAPKQSCTFLIKFTPTKTGIRAGSLIITDNALLASPFVILGGIGQ